MQQTKFFSLLWPNLQLTPSQYWNMDYTHSEFMWRVTLDVTRRFWSTKTLLSIPFSLAEELKVHLCRPSVTTIYNVQHIRWPQVTMAQISYWFHLVSTKLIKVSLPMEQDDRWQIRLDMIGRGAGGSWSGLHWNITWAADWLWHTSSSDHNLWHHPDATQVATLMVQNQEYAGMLNAWANTLSTSGSAQSNEPKVDVTRLQCSCVAPVGCIYALYHLESSNHNIYCFWSSNWTEQFITCSNIFQKFSVFLCTCVHEFCLFLFVHYHVALTFAPTSRLCTQTNSSVRYRTISLIRWVPEGR